MQLYSYYRSSASYRIRIALNLKGLGFELVPVDLVAREQKSDAYRRINSQSLVPTLVRDDGVSLSQSVAILEWLEEQYPEPALYPEDPEARAQHRALCLQIACDIHPLNNLRVLRYITGTLGSDDEALQSWYAHWIQLEFTTLEAKIAALVSPFSLGERPGMFEAFLIPQIYNARRFSIDLSDFPALVALDARCAPLHSFAAAHPHRQPDTPEELREA
ncbi:MAG: maleylacetoacetate isomerase [Pseudomonadota bacterium]